MQLETATQVEDTVSCAMVHTARRERVPVGFRFHALERSTMQARLHLTRDLRIAEDSLG